MASTCRIGAQLQGTIRCTIFHFLKFLCSCLCCIRRENLNIVISRTPNLRYERNFRSNTSSISHIFFPEKFDEFFLLESGTVIEEPPQYDTKEDEAEGVLQEKLGANCPIEKSGVGRMTEPAINAVSDESVTGAFVERNSMGEIS